jgi:hypothetical protein
MARAVEQGKPVPPVLFLVRGIPNSPDVYAKAHPDRVKKFPSSTKALYNPEENNDEKEFSGWRHELEHDAESVFWLLLYWAMVAQPENCHEERIDMVSWIQLNGDNESRERLIRLLPDLMSRNLIHSVYDPLRPLIKDLAAILVIDSHWLPVSDPRKDRLYIIEAFQRLILEFIIKNHGKGFMDHRIDNSFRKVNGMQEFGASSSTHHQSLDASMRVTAISVGC